MTLENEVDLRRRDGVCAVMVVSVVVFVVVGWFLFSLRFVPLLLGGHDVEDL